MEDESSSFGRGRSVSPGPEWTGHGLPEQEPPGSRGPPLLEESSQLLSLPRQLTKKHHSQEGLTDTVLSISDGVITEDGKDFVLGY